VPEDPAGQHARRGSHGPLHRLTGGTAIKAGGEGKGERPQAGRHRKTPIAQPSHRN